MQHRISRIVSAAVAAGALTGGLFVGATVAAPAPLDANSYVNLSPPQVSVSDVSNDVINLGAFQMTATNRGTSNISQLYLTGTTDDPVYAYAVTGAASDACGTVTYLSDPTALAPLDCSFGSLAPGYSVTVKVALISPSSGTGWSPKFAWSTTGYVTGKNKSHGDAWPISFSVSLTSGTKDSAGTYVWDASQPTVQTNQSISKKNPQASILTIDGTVQDVALYVQDGSGVQPPGVSDTSSFDCSGLVSSGTWTQAYANDDQYSGQLHTTITVYHGPNANTVTGVCYVHKVWNSNGTPYTVVATPLYNTPESDGGSLCSADPPAATDTLPCFTLTNQGPNLVISLYSDTNGFAGTW